MAVVGAGAVGGKGVHMEECSVLLQELRAENARRRRQLDGVQVPSDAGLTEDPLDALHAVIAATGAGSRLLSDAELLVAIVGPVRQMVESDVGAGFLCDEFGAAVLAATDGVSTEETVPLQDLHFLTEEQRRAVLQGATLVLPGTNLRDGESQIGGGLQERQALLVPVLAGERVRALLLVARANGSAYAEHEVRLLQALAALIAVTLANAAFHRAFGSIRSLIHELNQPLTVIVGYSSLLLHLTGEEDPQRVTLEALERNGRRISEVIHRLGEIARSQSESPETADWLVRGPAEGP